MKADPTHIDQVLVNLCVNARDAMPAGGVVAVAARNVVLGAADAERLGIRAGEYAAVSVSDSGHGMDSETAQRIFEPFFTTKTLGKGTGLGLSTVYGIASQSGGAVGVETARDTARPSRSTCRGRRTSSFPTSCPPLPRPRSSRRPSCSSRTSAPSAR